MQAFPGDNMRFPALAFAFLLLGAFAHADVLPDDGRYIPTCMKIANLGEYPDLVLIVEYFSLSNNDTNATQTSFFLFSGDSCSSLPNYNPSAATRIHYASKQYLDSVGGLSGIKLGASRLPVFGDCVGSCYRHGINDSNVHELSSQIALRNKSYVWGNECASQVIEQWKLTGNGSNVSLADYDAIKRCDILDCQNDEKTCPDGTKVLRNPGRNCEFQPCPLQPAPPNPQPQNPVPLGFFDGIICFFKQLFGQAC
jgi:hypothetical protein